MTNTYKLCQFQIMEGVITPFYQPIDKFVGNIFKGCYREYYCSYILYVSVKYKDQPFPQN